MKFSQAIFQKAKQNGFMQHKQIMQIKVSGEQFYCVIYLSDGKNIIKCAV